MTQQTAVRTSLSFERDGLAAAGFQTRLIPNSALKTAAADNSEPLIVLRSHR